MAAVVKFVGQVFRHSLQSKKKPYVETMPRVCVCVCVCARACVLVGELI